MQREKQKKAKPDPESEMKCWTDERKGRWVVCDGKLKARFGKMQSVSRRKYSREKGRDTIYAEILQS